VAAKRVLVVATTAPDEQRLREENTDPAEDVRDALRLFEPDEIVVVASGDGDDSWLEEEAVREAIAAPGVPVRRLDA
jgi:hypothetical protein